MTKAIIKSNLPAIIKEAVELNFDGKRIRKTRLNCAAEILVNLGLQKEVETGVLVDSLTEHFAAEKAKKAAAKKQVKKAEAVEIAPTFNGQMKTRDQLTEVLKGQCFIVTGAQNNTTVHPVLNALKAIAEQHDAEILAMPIKYTTTLEGLERKKPTYAKEVRAMLLDENVYLGSFGGVKLAVDAAILPTAKQPINAAERLNNGESITVVASPRNQLKTLARMKNDAHRWAYSTMVCTQMHYTDSRAGAEAEADHHFGGLFIRVNEDGTITHRQLVANEFGDIVDEGYIYDGAKGEIHHAEQPCVVLGDLHCEKMCEANWYRTLDWLQGVNPKNIAIHDALDMMSRNHHNREDDQFIYQMGQRAVIDDIADVVKHLNEVAKLASGKVYVVQSNHDLALDSWLASKYYDVKADPINAKTYYALKLAVLDMIDDGDDLVKLDLAIQVLADKLPELADNIVFGKVDELEQWFGVEVSMHGHLGTSGARGSVNSFKKMGRPTVTGHTHSPFRDGKNVVVGVCGSLEMGYNKGGTMWDRANAIINTNDTVQLVPTYAIGEFQY